MTLSKTLKGRFTQGDREKSRKCQECSHCLVSHLLYSHQVSLLYAVSVGDMIVIEIQRP